MRGLLIDSNVNPHRPLGSLRRAVFLAFVLLAIGLTLGYRPYLFEQRASAREFSKLPVTCPAQSPAIAPLYPFQPVEAEYPSVAAARLSGAIRVRTETYDASSPNGDDPSYDKFSDFEAYLRETYPVIFESLKLEHVASHGLLLTWQGSDSSLAPIILMAHQDTVPVPENTVERWNHPPFDGHIDTDGWIWGRGGGDCKNLLIGELSAVTELLRIGFKPQRTVLLSFGFDEEGGKVRSAQDLSAHVESIYGKDSMLFIIDEGEGIKEDYFGRTFITPALGEKGSTNIELTVAVPAYAQCLAEHSQIDSALKKALSRERTWDKAAAIMAANDAGDGARLMTTQAVDIIYGGVKVNALPEQATAIVNHRISVDSSVAEVQDRYVELLTPVAKHFNLTVIDFDTAVPEAATRYLKLSTPHGSNASPVSPYTGSAWDIFSGTARHLWGEDAIVAPLLMNGGTDTRAFQNLSRAIYRFEPLRFTDKYNIHTVDERIHIRGHMNTIRWIFALIQNADAFRE
ncbi:carboxypeptidase S [Mycena belliarum]|uniref:Carboxypeptidase S n=1 Tax=Mycena belliarum TaxID=1033014 RepID=A0AAD6UGA9_9AGAR|nr:carboxypeptidase S [Mycena belliae]